MSDLDPHLHPFALEDPSVTRLLRRADDSRFTGLLERAGAVATSVSLVVDADLSVSRPTLRAVRDWQTDRMRLELLVLQRDDEPEPAVLQEQLASLGRPWQDITCPPGGRAAGLAAAARAAQHEFVLVGSGGRPAFERVECALSLMWVEGADVALVSAGPDDLVDPHEVDDPSAALAHWLGLRGHVPPGRLVVMRRWVARWLFNEITRSISPADEVADRTRLLGLGIVQMATLPAAPPSLAA